jgi:hypothetical protein
MFVIGVPYFPGSDVAGSTLLAGSLAEDSVAQALGLSGGER